MPQHGSRAAHGPLAARAIHATLTGTRPTGCMLHDPARLASGALTGAQNWFGLVVSC